MKPKRDASAKTGIIRKYCTTEDYRMRKLRVVGPYNTLPDGERFHMEGIRIFTDGVQLAQRLRLAPILVSFDRTNYWLL